MNISKTTLIILLCFLLVPYYLDAEVFRTSRSHLLAEDNLSKDEDEKYLKPILNPIYPIRDSAIEDEDEKYLKPILKPVHSIRDEVEYNVTFEPFTPQTNSNILADEDSYKQCVAGVLPSFVNNSMYWGNGTSAYRGFKAISPPSIIVTGAGNYHPKEVSSIKAKASQNFDLIVVGSLAPDGRRSGFSQEGEAVHIMAPSDSSITSANDDGGYRRFGGTSGATPLVTAGLAGFEWLSGYHPTAKEAKFLLEKTAIPTLYSHDKPPKNGVGMLNSYKLGMVGKELKRLCGKNISCFKKMIKEPAVYNFPKDPGLIEAVDQAFPSCSRTCGGTVKSCLSKSKVFKRLRKASFLNPQDKKLWRKLACIYGKAGFHQEARAMINTYKALFGAPKNGREAYKTCKKDSDCTLTQSSCLGPPSLNPFSAMTHAEAEISYALCPSSCNGKCRCNNTEKVSNTTYSSRCVNSKCVFSTSSEAKLKPMVSPSSNNEPNSVDGQR